MRKQLEDQDAFGRNRLCISRKCTCIGDKEIKM
jgi:hypothetical protein